MYRDRADERRALFKSRHQKRGAPRSLIDQSYGLLVLYLTINSLTCLLIQSISVPLNLSKCLNNTTSYCLFSSLTLPLTFPLFISSQHNLNKLHNIFLILVVQRCAIELQICLLENVIYFGKGWFVMIRTVTHQ